MNSMYQLNKHGLRLACLGEYNEYACAYILYVLSKIMYGGESKGFLVRSSIYQCKNDLGAFNALVDINMGK